MGKIVRLISLPTTVRGLTVADPEGNSNVYINSNLSHEMQIQTYIHETTHIDNNDFNSQEPVKVLENRIKYKIKGRIR